MVKFSVTPEELQNSVLRPGSKTGLRGCGWEEQNYPQGHQTANERNTCPHTEILLECAQIIGISREQVDANASKFCGRHVVQVNNLGPLSGRQGTEYHPDSFCERINRVLLQILVLFSQQNEVIPTILQDGRFEVTITGKTVSELEANYRKVRNGITFSYYAGSRQKITDLFAKTMKTFGKSLNFDSTMGLALMHPEIGEITQGRYFNPSQGCPIAPKDDFSGMVS